MDYKVVEHETDGYEGKKGGEDVLARYYTDTKEETETDTAFPCQKEGTVAGATLAMIRQLDEEEQEAATHNAYGKAYKSGRNELYGHCLAREFYELGSEQEKQSRKHFTLQVGIGKDKTLCHDGLINHRMGYGEEDAYRCGDEQQIEEQRCALRQKETVEREKRHVVGRSLERELDHCHQAPCPKGCCCGEQQG